MPFSTNDLDIAAPIPALAPVTIATWFTQRSMSKMKNFSNTCANKWLIITKYNGI